MTITIIYSSYHKQASHAQRKCMQQSWGQEAFYSHSVIFLCVCACVCVPFFHMNHWSPIQLTLNPQIKLNQREKIVDTKNSGKKVSQVKI